MDLFCGAGGAARGYQLDGFHVTGVDNKTQPRYIGEEFVQADALEFLAEHGHDYDAIHASPPCQGYSIMHNLPWLRGRDYPLLLLPTIEMLEALGKPYVVENVMGARYGSKTLQKRGLEAHGLKAGWLCGAMFGLPFYRHRLFATNWMWFAPGHPKHKSQRPRGITSDSRGRGITEQVVANPVNTEWRQYHDGALNIRPGYEKVPLSYPTIVGERLRANGRPKDSKIGLSNGMPETQLANWQNGAQSMGVGIGHAKGWRLAAEAMGIDWMKREELTQAIPLAYTEFIGRQLRAHLATSDNTVKTE